jgi:hypothetical protein
MRTSLILAAVFLLSGGGLMEAQVPGPSGQIQNLPNLREAKVGTKTYPELLKELNAPDPAVKEAAMQAMIVFASEQSYLKTVQKEAVPLIIFELNNPATTDASIKVNGALALGLLMPKQTGPDGTIGLDEKTMDSGVKCLIRLLGDYESVVRQYAATALGRIGQDARAAIPALVKETKDKAAWEIRRAAFAGLAQMAIEKVEKGKEPQGPDPRVFRAFTDGVNDHCLQVRQEAIKGFFFTGPLFIPMDVNNPNKTNSAKSAHREAITALENAVMGRDKSTSILARVAIMQIDPPTLMNPQKMDRYIHEISRFLKGGQETQTQVRIDASYGLMMAWRLATNLKGNTNRPDPNTFTAKSGWGQAIHGAIVNLDDRDDTIVCWGCKVLGTMGKAATQGDAGKKTTIPALQRLKERVASKPANDPTKKTMEEMVEWALKSCHGKEAGPVGAFNRSGE